MPATAAASGVELDAWRRLGTALRRAPHLAAAARARLRRRWLGFEVPPPDRALRRADEAGPDPEQALGRFLLDARPLPAADAARQLGETRPLLGRLGLLEGDAEVRLRGVRLLPLGTGWAVVPLAGAAGAPHPWVALNYGEDTHMMLDRVAGRDLRASTVLDVGTGPGVLAAACALEGARVTAIDVDPDAVRAATCNRALAGVDFDLEEARIEEYLPPARFDLVLFNSPFLPLLPGGRLPLCGDGGPDGMTVVRAFLRRLEDLLGPAGSALVTIRLETPSEHAPPDLRPFGRLLPGGWTISFASSDRRPLVEDLFLLCAKQLAREARTGAFETLLAERDVRGWAHYGILEVRP